MNQEIKASYLWTVDEMIKARENHGRAQCRPGFRAGIIFIAIIMIIPGIICFCERTWSIPTCLLPLVGLYILVLRKYDIRWGLRRHFKKRPDKNAQVVWTANDNYLQIDTGNSESKQNWNQISKVRKGRNGFLLYPNDTIFYWLPFEAFSSETDEKLMESLLRIKVNDFADIK